MKKVCGQLWQFLAQGGGCRVMLREFGVFVTACLLVSMILLGVSQCSTGTNVNDREAMRDQ